jgi:membrane-associated protein
MELIAQYIDFVLHFDRHLDVVIQQYGFWTYLLLFLIIFCETGLVVTPILPGDSLLFVCGTFAARGSLTPESLIIILCIAAISGDTVNYWIGYWLGPNTLQKKNLRWIKKEYLDRTHEFYEKYGGKTIILARFVPIVRTFAPFVAGIGSMRYSYFIIFNIAGGMAWIMSFVLGGYFFGNIPIVKGNFTLVIMVIIVISVMPGVIEFLRNRKAKTRQI